MKFTMKVENLTLIEKLRKVEKRLLEIERNLVLMERKLDEYDNKLEQKNKGIEEVQDHLFVPHLQIFG